MLKNQLKIYLEMCFLAAFCVAIFGFLGPCLMSADDPFSPILGVIVMLAVPPVAWVSGRHVFNLWKEANETVKQKSRNRSARSNKSGSL